MQMNGSGSVLCIDNKELVNYLLDKRQELTKKPKGLSDNVDSTLSRAYQNICNAKNPIKTIKDLSQIKGVGKWIIKLMKGYFETDCGSSEPEDLPEKGKKTRGAKRYVPQRHSAAYAILIALYREIAKGNEFMHKQELIDAAEASGLSRVPIAQEKGKGKPGHFGSSPRDMYSGWNCMKTLTLKGLVVRANRPAKYMLTEEGRGVAQECLMRSGMTDPIENLGSSVDMVLDCDGQNSSDLDTLSDSAREVTLPCISSSRQKESIDIPPEYLERFTRMGYTKDQVLLAYSEVSATAQNKNITSLWLAVMCHLRENDVYNAEVPAQTLLKGSRITSGIQKCNNGQVEIVGTRSNQIASSSNHGHSPRICSDGATTNSFSLRACSSSDGPVQKSASDSLAANINILSMPPLRFGERFEEAYEVILVLDDREQFATRGSRSRKIIDNICSEFKIEILVRRLPVGDGIWIARHKYLQTEYVLDFIVERKNIDDLRSSIRDKRYRDQKLRLLESGRKKLIYLVEGDPNSSEAAESIKTACFTTEILEGFDVQRTGGLSDTLRKYGFLTQAIAQYYKSHLPDDPSKCLGVCPPFDEFVKRCKDLDKMTVSDVFATQLMQVPQVTEDIAVAVLDMYPTVLSLARAYSLLEGGDMSAQEEMLKKQSNNLVSATASKNIFQLVWGD